MNFKVGDWVIEKGDSKPRQLTDRYIDAIKNCGDWSDFSKWQPKEGEVYWDLYNGELCKCISTSTSKYGVVEVFGEVIKPSKIRPINYRKVYCILSECEPFIGELPSFLKETKC